jgi:hypothetical protein
VQLRGGILQDGCHLQEGGVGTLQIGESKQSKFLGQKFARFEFANVGLYKKLSVQVSLVALVVEVLEGRTK